MLDDDAVAANSMPGATATDAGIYKAHLATYTQEVSARFSATK